LINISKITTTIVALAISQFAHAKITMDGAIVFGSTISDTNPLDSIAPSFIVSNSNISTNQTYSRAYNEYTIATSETWKHYDEGGYYWWNWNYAFSNVGAAAASDKSSVSTIFTAGSNIGDSYFEIFGTAERPVGESSIGRLDSARFFSRSSIFDLSFSLSAQTSATFYIFADISVVGPSQTTYWTSADGSQTYGLRDFVSSSAHIKAKDKFGNSVGQVDTYITNNTESFAGFPSQPTCHEWYVNSAERLVVSECQTTLTIENNSSTTMTGTIDVIFDVYGAAIDHSGYISTIPETGRGPLLGCGIFVLFFLRKYFNKAKSAFL